jgi:hypothetical protein
VWVVGLICEGWVRQDDSSLRLGRCLETSAPAWLVLTARSRVPCDAAPAATPTNGACTLGSVGLPDNLPDEVGELRQSRPEFNLPGEQSSAIAEHQSLERSPAG